MLELKVAGQEYFNEQSCEFITVPEATLRLEHSLVSVSKWESKWRKPFLGDKPKTTEESVDYVRCMALDESVDPLVYKGLTAADMEAVDRYINAPMTATWFSEEQPKPRGSKAITAELIYCRMFALGIDMRCEAWHLNRLLTLIRVCNEENAPKKKMSRKEQYRQRRELNERRRKAMHSAG